MDLFRARGEKVSLLAFLDKLSAIEIRKDFLRFGDFLFSSLTKEGAEMNVAKPIKLKDGNKIKGDLIPMYFDKAQGVSIEIPEDNSVQHKEFIEKRKMKRDSKGDLYFDPAGEIEKTFLCELYPGLPIYKKTGIFKKTVINPEYFARQLLFDISPVLALIDTNPKLMGAPTDSHLVKETFIKKPFPYQLVIASLVSFLLGGFFLGGAF